MEKFHVIPGPDEQYQVRTRNELYTVTFDEPEKRAIFEAIMVGLENGDRVELRGFGSFEIRAWEGRIGRNPRTGVVVHVVPKRHVRFRGSKQLQERMTAARPE